MTTQKPAAIVGQRVARTDAYKKVTGAMTYADDLFLPNMLHAKLLLSPHAHARSVSIGTSRAKALEGVRAVLTGQEIPSRPQPTMMHGHLLARDKVRFYGDPVAMVAADDETTASRAIRLIDVQYEPLPHVTDQVEAMQPGAPRIYDEGNVQATGRLHKGDAAALLKLCDVVHEETYRLAAVHQAYMEPRSATAAFDPTGRLTVWTSTQTVHSVKSQLGRWLQLPESKITVINIGCGGGFGGKLQAIPETYAALLARKAGRPVRLTLTRREDLLTGNPRKGLYAEVKIGALRDGTFKALHARLIWDQGAYDTYAVTHGQGPVTMGGLYRFDAVEIESVNVFTNTLPRGSYRCPTAPKVIFALESAIDGLAKRLGMDRLELRLKNCLTQGERSATGQLFTSIALKETIERAAEAVRWGKKGPNQGQGMASVFWFTLQLPTSVFLRIADDGKVYVITGGTETGTGSIDPSIAMVVAETLGVPLADVSVAADSTEGPWDPGASGSKTLSSTGYAAWNAAKEARSRLLDLAAARLQVQPEAVSIEGGRLFVKDSPEQAVTIAQLASAAKFQEGPLSFVGKFAPKPPAFDPKTIDNLSGGAFNNPSWGTHACTVEVDPETGNVRILKYVAAHDVGKVVNPLGCEGQIQGGAFQSIGQALTEGYSWDAQGRPLTASFGEYLVPTTADIPPIDAIMIESAPGTGTMGAKGIGEPPVAPGPAAIANAIEDAIGVRITETPITPERVRRAIREKEAWEAEQARRAQSGPYPPIKTSI